jgi:hypothetical protein
MLIARGYRPEVFLVDGRLVRGCRGGEILHDEKGADFDRRSVLIMAFAKTGKPLERMPKHVRQHFGQSDHVVKTGRVHLPPQRISMWEEIGEVERIEYYRRGEHSDPAGYAHSFGERRAFALSSGKKPVLYKRGEVLRIVGVSWSWAGATG